jgi:hypothetical protein
MKLSQTRRLSIWSELPESISSYNIEWRKIKELDDLYVKLYQFETEAIYIGYDQSTGAKKFKALKKENYIINRICISENCYSVANGVKCKQCEKKQ